MAVESQTWKSPSAQRRDLAERAAGDEVGVGRGAGAGDHVLDLDALLGREDQRLAHIRRQRRTVDDHERSSDGEV